MVFNIRATSHHTTRTNWYSSDSAASKLLLVDHTWANRAFICWTNNLNQHQERSKAVGHFVLFDNTYILGVNKTKCTCASKYQYTSIKHTNIKKCISSSWLRSSFVALEVIRRPPGVTEKKRKATTTPTSHQTSNICTNFFSIFIRSMNEQNGTTLLTISVSIRFRCEKRDTNNAKFAILCSC